MHKYSAGARQIWWDPTSSAKRPAPVATPAFVRFSFSCETICKSREEQLSEGKEGTENKPQENPWSLQTGGFERRPNRFQDRYCREPELTRAASVVFLCYLCGQLTQHPSLPHSKGFQKFPSTCPLPPSFASLFRARPFLLRNKKLFIVAFRTREHRAPAESGHLAREGSLASTASFVLRAGCR